MGLDRPLVLVLDASVILKWALGAENEPKYAEAERLLNLWTEGEIEILVPTLWVYEVGNILALKRPDVANELLLSLMALGLREVMIDPGLATLALDIAREFRTTLYDASYLAVAQAHQAVLVTADGKFLDRLPPTAPAVSL